MLVKLACGELVQKIKVRQRKSPRVFCFGWGFFGVRIVFEELLIKAGGVSNLINQVKGLIIESCRLDMATGVVRQQSIQNGGCCYQ